MSPLEWQKKYNHFHLVFTMVDLGFESLTCEEIRRSTHCFWEWMTHGFVWKLTPKSSDHDFPFLSTHCWDIPNIFRQTQVPRSGFWSNSTDSSPLCKNRPPRWASWETGTPVEMGDVTNQDWGFTERTGSITPRIQKTLTWHENRSFRWWSKIWWFKMCWIANFRSGGQSYTPNQVWGRRSWSPQMPLRSEIHFRGYLNFFDIIWPKKGWPEPRSFFHVTTCFRIFRAEKTPTGDAPEGNGSPFRGSRNARRFQAASAMIRRFTALRVCSVLVSIVSGGPRPRVWYWILNSWIQVV